jgi:hypothetical protein
MASRNEASGIEKMPKIQIVRAKLATLHYVRAVATRERKEGY